MNIICFLTVCPTFDTYNYYKLIQKNSKYKVYIVIDKNDYVIPDYDGEVEIIQINNITCETLGYKNSVLWFPNKACSRDKALYYFIHNSIEYDNIWFIEEDVFIPKIELLESMDSRYQDDDLLVKEFPIYHKKQKNWHWEIVYRDTNIQPPFSNSMICAIRCSKKMLSTIEDYVLKYKSLFLDEAMFTTLATHSELKVSCPKELKNITWNEKWTLNNVEEGYLYHPVKDMKKQKEFRNKLFDNII